MYYICTMSTVINIEQRAREYVINHISPEVEKQAEQINIVRHLSDFAIQILSEIRRRQSIEYRINQNHAINTTHNT